MESKSTMDKGFTKDRFSPKNNITDLEAALTNINFTRQQLPCILDTIPAGIVIVRASDRRNLYFNDRGLELLGIDASVTDVEAYIDQIQLFRTDGFPYPEDEQPVNRTLSTGETLRQQEMIIRKPDGEQLDLLVSAAPIFNDTGMVTAAMVNYLDVTGLRRTENALRKSEKSYRELVKHAPTAIFEYDFRTDHFVSVNDILAELTGYNTDELLKMSLTDILAKSDVPLFQARARQWLSGEMPISNVDYELCTKNGDQIFLALNTTFTCDYDGHPTGATVVAHNITQRRMMEQILRLKTEELELANQNKSQFLNVLSHELRNPLAAIVSSQEILAHFCRNDEKVMRAIGVLKRQTAHMTRMVDDLLDITRINNNRIKLIKAPVEITELLYTVVSDVRPKFTAKNVSLELNFSDKPLIINADADRMTQIVLNIIDNSLKFTPSGGLVTVGCQCTPDKHAVQIEFIDNGEGISPEILPHLFDEFSQAEQPLDRSQGGLGLGLSIAKGIVDLHGGIIKAFSEGIGKGTRFLIQLPLDTSSLECI